MTFPRPDFSADAIAAAKQHAVESFPKESCGFIVAGQYVRAENIAPEPEKDFRIHKDEYLKAVEGGLQAVIHSHPHPFTRSPSAEDMRTQVDTAVIWGIIPCNAQEAYGPVFWGDFLLEGDLIGREFLHGINDCYTQVRGWYWQNRGIKLPEVPRDEDWWKNGGDLYSSFGKFGFKMITMKQAQEGDCILARVRSAVPNHAGVILNGNLVQHHVHGRLSGREPWGPWNKHITHWLRYEG